MTKQDDWVSVARVGDVLEVTQNTLYSWIRKIETYTDYQFQRQFIGHYVYGQPQKQVIMTDEEMALMGQLKQARKSYPLKGAILRVFARHAMIKC